VYLFNVVVFCPKEFRDGVDLPSVAVPSTGRVVAEREGAWIGRLKNALYSEMVYLLWINSLYSLFRKFQTTIHLFPVLNMKRFILKSGLFVLIFLALAHARPLYLLDNGRYKHSGAGSEIYYSISKSERKNKTSAKILLGDSVARQMFNNVTSNEPINSMACNQAIGMVGHFILLNNYLKAGNHVDTVYLLFTPFSFLNNLNDVYTYHYFLKPFYVNKYFPLFTQTVIDQIHKIPYYYLSRCPYVLTSKWAPDFVSKDKVDYTFLSPISAEYLVRIKELSNKYSFRLIVIPTPTSLSNRRKIEKMNKNEIVVNNLQSEFEDYFSNIVYLDDSNFLSDGVHLINPQKYAEYYRNSFMK
jgi:hypothetical protein